MGGNYFSVDDVRVLPGKYDGKLYHDCYEDISIDSVNISRNGQVDFDMEGKVKLKQSNLALYAKYKGRNQKESVFVNGKQVGETPYKGAVPLCSKIALGKENEKDKLNVLPVGLQHNKDVEYTYRLPTWKSTLLSLAIGAVGGYFLYAALDEKDKASNYEKEYGKLTSKSVFEYDELANKQKKHHDKMNVNLGVSGGLFISAIGVYLWF